jgi:hypothetical protein
MQEFREKVLDLVNHVLYRPPGQVMNGMSRVCTFQSDRLDVSSHGLSFSFSLASVFELVQEAFQLPAL